MLWDCNHKTWNQSFQNEVTWKMTTFQEKKKYTYKFLQNKFPEEISTMFLYRLQEEWMTYSNKNLCVTSVTSTDPGYSRGRWKAFMKTNAFLQGFVVQLKGKDKRKPAPKDLFFSFFSDFQTKGAFSQGSIRQAEQEWVTAQGLAAGAEAHTGWETLSGSAGQTPACAAGRHVEAPW